VTIRWDHIEGVLEIQSWWKFSAKRSNQSWTPPDLAKMEHLNESMAVRIPHPGVICFFAIHAEEYEGYAFWWNGGTLWDMFNLDDRYPKDILVQVAYLNASDEDFLGAMQLCRFREKRTKLAWALLHIMDEVHKSHNLHNDISLEHPSSFSSRRVSGVHRGM
jgi:hypothetical protein